MNAWAALCKREWREHKGSLGWGPVIVAGVIIGIALLALVLGEFGSVHINVDEIQGDNHEIHIHDDDADLGDMVDHFLSQRSWTDEALTQALDRLRHGIAAPFYGVFAIILFFVLLGALYDERKDRTVLFWKSMPVTDSATVLSKLVTMVWLAPAVNIAMIAATQFFFFVVITFFVAGREDIGVWRLWSHSGLVLGVIELVVGYAMQGLWSLPVYAWLLLVSSAVTKVPFLWAVLTPVVPVLVERLLFGSSVLAAGIGNHVQLRALPRAAETEDGVLRPPVEMPDILALLTTGELWVGLVVGAVFLYGAIHLRRRNNEI